MNSLSPFNLPHSLCPFIAVTHRVLSQDTAFSTISLLEMNGFEAPSQSDNGFGSFCRNYANECVQELFNKNFFDGEVKEYEQEGVILPNTAFPNNSGCVGLMDRQVKAADFYEY